MKFFNKILFCLIIITTNLSAQYHEIGAFLGGSNYIGDVGTTRFVYPNSSAFGLVYKWNLTTRYSLRAGINISNIKGSDYNTNDLNRFKRGYKFDNNINEFIAGIEFNFIDFNLHDGKTIYTPYTFVGLGYFEYDLKKAIEFKKYDSDQTIAIPIILGLKMNPNPLWVIGLEIGVRYSFTDSIDGSNPIKEYGNDTTLKFGNLGNNDWYVFTGLTISFTFGDIPCYCKE